MIDTTDYCVQDQFQGRQHEQLKEIFNEDQVQILLEVTTANETDNQHVLPSISLEEFNSLTELQSDLGSFELSNEGQASQEFLLEDVFQYLETGIDDADFENMQSLSDQNVLQTHPWSSNINEFQEDVHIDMFQNLNTINGNYEWEDTFNNTLAVQEIFRTLPIEEFFKSDEQPMEIFPMYPFQNTSNLGANHTFNSRTQPASPLNKKLPSIQYWRNGFPVLPPLNKPTGDVAHTQHDSLMNTFINYDIPNFDFASSRSATSFCDNRFPVYEWRMPIITEQQLFFPEMQSELYEAMPMIHSLPYDISYELEDGAFLSIYQRNKSMYKEEQQQVAIGVELVGTPGCGKYSSVGYQNENKLFKKKRGYTNRRRKPKIAGKMPPPKQQVKLQQAGPSTVSRSSLKKLKKFP